MRWCCSPSSRAEWRTPRPAEERRVPLQLRRPFASRFHSGPEAAETIARRRTLEPALRPALSVARPSFARPPEQTAPGLLGLGPGPVVAVPEFEFAASKLDALRKFPCLRLRR